VLSTALETAGIDPGETYLTNAVKHFRFQRRGMRRIHEAPELRHLVACQPWLQVELEVVDPDVVVCLGPPPVARCWDARSGSAQSAARCWRDPADGPP